MLPVLHRDLPLLYKFYIISKHRTELRIVDPGRKIVCSFLFILGPIALGSRLGASQTGPAMPDNVKAVFKERCAVCHKGKYPPKQLNLEPEGLPASLLNAPSREQPALKLVDTASPEASYLLKKIKGSEGITGKIMPPPGKAALTGDEIALVENWIMGLEEGRPAIAFREVGFGSGDLLASSAPTQAPADKSKKSKSAYEKPPFWGTRLVNLPTGMTMDKGDFLFRISHRLVPSVRTGYDTAWGLDGPSMAFVSLGYGITDRIGGQFMFLGNLSLISEWVPVLAGYKDIANGWGFGIEKKLGGHVFQFFITNSIGLNSAQFVTGGDLRLGKGDLRIGFNIFRTF